MEVRDLTNIMGCGNISVVFSSPPSVTRGCESL